ncbi:hypothetical protein GCM10009779_02710 [Polymorphospora rubra]|uniref:Uncharacterized protein n=2 Tax=Polymorphospora rubra TaxID=338584 RepID=A0A810MWY7_9ACTN|nr:hypothetical protein Prubr_27070 [Polymorphospora rubra]
MAGAVVPFLSAAAGVYGSAVVQRVTDRGADVTADVAVGWGRRLMGLFLGSSRSAQVGAAVTDVAENPDDEAFTAALFAQVRRALAEDDRLAGEVAAILAEAGVAGGSKFTVTVSGSTGVQVGDHNTQTITMAPPPAR